MQSATELIGEKGPRLGEHVEETQDDAQQSVVVIAESNVDRLTERREVQQEEVQVPPAAESQDIARRGQKGKSRVQRPRPSKLGATPAAQEVDVPHSAGSQLTHPISTQAQPGTMQLQKPRRGRPPKRQPTQPPPTDLDQLPVRPDSTGIPTLRPVLPDLSQQPWQGRQTRSMSRSRSRSQLHLKHDLPQQPQGRQTRSMSQAQLQSQSQSQLQQSRAFTRRQPLTNLLPSLQQLHLPQPPPPALLPLAPFYQQPQLGTTPGQPIGTSTGSPHQYTTAPIGPTGLLPGAGGPTMMGFSAAGHRARIRQQPQQQGMTATGPGPGIALTATAASTPAASTPAAVSAVSAVPGAGNAGSTSPY
ncbi:hypothetical protein Egran_01678 [Elaphomyces granulatus]|uniref:Uncharacterized protein n=1 Tax=Elaphomyces granulatus TaxID=519963 RepID=A0A232M2C1_9EURO|nr:hypothetical protein Egran_01678 [Elaphomyces granulatus]